MRILPAVCAVVALSFLLVASTPAWLNSGGDLQRSGWQKRDRYINRDTLKDFKLLWKLKLDNEAIGLNSLSAPVIFGPIITHRGMKELVFFSGASDNVYALDADLGRIFWQRHIDTPFRISLARWPCLAGMTAAPVLAPVPPAVPGSKYANEENEDPTPPRPLYVVSSDGKLHSLRTTTGADIGTPVQFIPPNARAANLTMAAGSAYTTTSDDCGGAQNGLWALDVTAPDAKTRFFATPGSARGGVSIGPDNTVYSAFGWLFASDPASLNTKGFFAPPAVDAVNATPIPFKWKGRELLVTSTSNGRLMLLDAQQPRKILFTGAPVGGDGLATWEDKTRTRWIYSASPGNIIAFTVSGTETSPALTQAWTSREITAPATPAIVNGMVFALATGEFTGTNIVEERIAKSTSAVLYALDAATGKELYSSGGAVTSFTHSSSLAVANGHVCFGTFDNTVYCFGIPTDI